MAGPGQGGRRGPVYDDAMKVLAEDDPAALLRVLPPTAELAEDGPMQSLDRELAGSAVRTDLLVRLSQSLVHGEYVKDPTDDLALRMVDYRLRIRRRHREVRVVQFVLVLRRGFAVPDRYDDPDGSLSARWAVVQVAGLDRHRLLAAPTTAALAALVDGSLEERAAALTAAADVIAALDGPRRRRVVDAAATLSSIHLPPPIIESALQEAAMPVPIRELPLARALLDEGREQGRVEGEALGEHRAAVRMTSLLLRRRFGDDARIETVAEALAALPDERRLDLIASATRLDDLLA